MATNGKVRYSPASQNEAGNLEVEIQQGPDKSRQTWVQKCALYSCFVGFVFILLGIIFAFIMKPVIVKKIRSHLPLEEDSLTFQAWKHPPVTPVLFVRVFNLTNKEAFLAGREKPNVVEVGPYAYRQKLEKTNVQFTSGKNAVRYETRKWFEFAPEMSAGSETDDIVVVPNIPLFGAIKTMATQMTIAKTVFKNLMNSYDFAIDNKPFLTLTVKDFLWGYPSLLLSMEKATRLGCQEKRTREQKWDEFDEVDWDYAENKPKGEEAMVDKAESDRPECDITANNQVKFGLFRQRNGTVLDPTEINTGVANLTEKGLMISWNDMRRLKFWTETDAGCNVISGSRDPGIMPLDIQRGDSLPLFIGNMGRTIHFHYSHEVHVGDFLAYRFVPKENSFDNATDNPANECYCVKPAANPCLPSGLHNISPAQPGSPIVLSWPHFLYGDHSLKMAVDGLHPDHKKHIFMFDIEPTYGMTLRALARLQMNVEIPRDSGFGYFDNIMDETLYLPFVWIEEGVLGPSEIVSQKVKLLLKMPSAVRNLAVLLGLGLGILMLIPEIFFWIRSCFRKPATKTEPK